MATDDHSLQRFVRAQAAVYEGALHELRAGHKTGHWMWFIFPQLAGLGRSEVSRYYAIGSLEEARAYLTHPVLGPRLLECADALLELGGRPAEAILGSVDAMKLRSSMTLFGRVAPSEVRFGEVLKQYFEGQEDDATLGLLVQRGAELLSSAIDDVDSDARTATEVLDGIPGAFEAAERGYAEAAAGLGVPLDDLREAPRDI